MTTALLLQTVPQSIEIQIPHGWFYGLIGFLVIILASVISVFGGLWLRSHDAFRQWATDRLNQHEQTIAILHSAYENVGEDVAEIKMMLAKQDERTDALHDALIEKFGLEIRKAP